jgi:chromosome transmission fidelity protein 1
MRPCFSPPWGLLSHAFPCLLGHCSKVLLKVGGFGDARMAEAAAAAPSGVDAADPAVPGSPYPTSATAALQALLSFVVALTAPEADGRVLMWPAQAQGGASNRPHPHGRLKFVLLSPANRFAPVVGAARAVIMAGGTLGPPAVLAASLCPGLGPRLHSHSCGHIVPADQLLAIALARGPSGAALDFTYTGRMQPAAMDELGRVLLNVCRCAPHGCVAFFPSFEYVDACCARWASSGAWETLGEAKPIFREPRTSGSVEPLLERYGAAAVTGKGALLLCVVGGKLSEGINFSDRLGRCVVMVGLPYAPPSDAELAERMAWLEAATPEQGGGPGSGRAYYEALCMRAVNQSIGRAIRHAKDYAAIVLVDTRWTKPVAEGGVAGKLPGWMAGSLVTVRGECVCHFVCVRCSPARATQVNGNFGEAYGRMHRFFKERAESEGP